MEKKVEWSLIENGKDLKPLEFSNGKTQDGLVKEILNAIQEGNKVIFIEGKCGTGKSAVALNLAKELGSASIVVPVKALQKQYELDYTKNKYLEKKGKRLKISSITGRQNHKCPFFEENPGLFKEEKKEKNSTLNIFDNNKPSFLNRRSSESPTCDNSLLPCKIPIKKKNMEMIKKYLKKNENIRDRSFVNINDIKRMSLAPACDYWSPIIPSNVRLNLDADKKKYMGMNDIEYTIYLRGKNGCSCPYYEQYLSYLDSDVLIFNSHKYKLETTMNRKPKTEVEIIDECDEFLDSFSNTKQINLTRLNFSLGTLYPKDEEVSQTIKEVARLVSLMSKDEDIKKYVQQEKILKIDKTKIYDLLRKFLDTDFLDSVEADEENYCFHVDEVARTFSDLFDETYLSFYKQDKEIIAKLVTINLEKRFQEMLEKNKVFVMMSGTIHSSNVLKEIFGIQNYKMIEAETKMPGKLTKKTTGKEINCKYSNFKSGKITRDQYLLSLQECVDKAKKPCLVHINSFGDLPSEREVEELDLHLISREKFFKLQKNAEEMVQKFKDKKIPVLYSTKCSRGVDFPGEICNSIVMTKYPFPAINSLFWRILRETRPQHFNSFYMDKAKREFLQKIYRGLRSNEDEIELLSPDIRVFYHI